MLRIGKLALPAVLLAALAACRPDYSPNTYASTAVQQANKVDKGVVVGVREVGVSSNTTAGAVTGGAAGAVVGAQTPGGGVGEAFGAIGGTVIGGLVGANGDLLSVTQKDTTPLQIGQNVLVIAGNQARIVPDYTVPIAGETQDKDKAAPLPGALPDLPAVAAAPVVPLPTTDTAKATQTTAQVPVPAAPVVAPIPPPAPAQTPPPPPAQVPAQ